MPKGRPRLKTTHCKHGHRYTTKTTYIYYDKRGWRHRMCKACRDLRLTSSKEKARRRNLYRTNSKFRASMIARAKAHYEQKTPQERCRYVNAQRERKKLEALTHYGKGGKLMCCWRGCTVSDVDMLSLDHIKDDGVKHRKKLGKKINGIHQFGGKEIYHWVIINGFPKGLQTLCMNHQWKKQRIKNRAERLA